MPIRVDAYMSDGVASGSLVADGTLHGVLDTGSLVLESATWQTLGTPSRERVGVLRLVSDEVLVAIGDDEAALSVHATWHRVRLESGPFVVEGDLATLPGFDPGRAITRPSGAFLELRDVRLGRVGQESAGAVSAGHGLVNRYAVEQLQADLMLGFFFPGAVIESTEIQPQIV